MKLPQIDEGIRCSYFNSGSQFLQLVQKKYYDCQVYLGYCKNGLKIDFESRPKNHYIPKLFKKGVIIPCDKEKEDFMSTIFTRKNKKWKYAHHSETKILKQACQIQSFPNGVTFRCI